ncbi:MAG TPA: right-handed parallel beta-helix repeat-containing protein [Oligoflexia bacterium]|nr:right-handed parallel beta-helix repeat-containing protein [Oligoflexia bacterium]
MLACDSSIEGKGVCSLGDIELRTCSLPHGQGQESFLCDLEGWKKAKECSLETCEDGYFEKNQVCQAMTTLGGTQYYVSSDGNDSNPGTRSAPWKTLNKVNTMFSNLSAGDAVLFRRGDQFRGSLQINKSGNSSSPILVGAYGEGKRPVLTGFTQVTQWQNDGGGVYYADIQDLTSDVNTVAMNGSLKAVGRYPNDTWLTAEAVSGSSSITDNELTSSPNWTGAQALVRKNRWIFDRMQVTSHSGQTLSLSGGGYNATPGYGYFFQRDRKTLDVFGEWYVEETAAMNSNRLYVYFGQSGPSHHKVEVSVHRDVIYNLGHGYIVISDLQIEGGDRSGLYLANAPHVTLQNSRIQLIGDTAVLGENNSINSDNLIIYKNTISSIANRGIKLGIQFPNALIDQNHIQDIAIFPGMSGNSDNQGGAFISHANNGTITNNTIERIGYTGVHFYGGGMLVENNVVRDFCLVKDDGAGIYSYQGEAVRAQSMVRNNIVVNGFGNSEGTPNGEGDAFGIYMDDLTENVSIENNSVGMMGYAPLYIHNAQRVDVLNNTFFDGHRAGALMKHDNLHPSNPIREIEMTNNTFINVKSGQAALSIYTLNEDVGQMGIFNNNHYVLSDQSGTAIAWGKSGDGTHRTGYNTSTWFQSYGYGEQSQTIVANSNPYIVNNSLSSNLASTSSINLFSYDSSITIDPIEEKDYRLSFSITGSADDVIRFSISKVSNYLYLSELLYAEVTEQVQNYEFIIKMKLSESNPMIYFDAGPDFGSATINNIELIEVDTTSSNLAPKMFYNENDFEIVVPLNQAYQDLNQNNYSEYLRLSPMSSKILWPQN